MKANAPEKIYIHPDIGGREFLRPWLHMAANNESVEYVRTDAFIEKACEWLEPILKNYAGCYRGKDILGDFKKYVRRVI